MKLALVNRQQLLSLGKFLVDEFDSLVARIRGAWNVEHNDDDTHGHVHADSLATGRLTFAEIADSAINNASVNNYETSLLSTAAILRLTSSLSKVALTGLKVPQDERGVVLDGRVLVIENTSSTTVFVFECEHTASFARNRFITPYGPPPDSTTTLQFYVAPLSLVVLIYDAKKARWVIQSQIKDANESFHSFTAARQDNVSTTGLRRVQTAKVEFAGTGGSISGFDATSVIDLTRLTITNTGLYKFALLHMNTNSLAANRLECPGGVQYLVNPRESVDLLKTPSGWKVVEKADQWIDVAFVAGNFTAATGAWTVAAGDLETYSYQLDGNRMVVSFRINTSTVSATPAYLAIAIPNSRIAARGMYNQILVIDNAVRGTGTAEVIAGGTTIRLYTPAGGNWATAVDTTGVWGQITFMVRDDSATISEAHTDLAHGDAVHGDVLHSDVPHSDIAHGDSHGDAAHSDILHSDILHTDAHSDTAHTDTHSDVAHSDVVHSDAVHSDVLHSDSPHSDVVHQDSAHTDTHSDVAHSDVVHSDAPHDDSHNDAHEDVPAHDDGIILEHTDTHSDVHGDIAHSDTAHSDSHTDSHGDTAHSDSHTDVAHGDVTHSDTPHGDAAHSDSHTDTHSDVAHVDTHSDVAHSDVAHVDGGHSDTHSDTAPHSDIAHIDVAHSDSAHADSVHQDVGQHTDTAHSDI